MFTTNAPPGDGSEDGRHYLRITEDQDPNDGDLIPESNGQRPLDERRMLPGFKGSSQRLPASIVAPRQRLRRAFSSQGSFAVWH